MMKTYKVRIFKDFEVQAKEGEDTYGVAFAQLEALLGKYPAKMVFSSKAREKKPTPFKSQNFGRGASSNCCISLPPRSKNKT